MLSTRTKNALWCILMQDGGWGYRESDWLPDPAEVAKLDPRSLRFEPNIGKVAMLEIETYLKEHGLRFEKGRDELRWNLARLREREKETATSLERIRTRIVEIEAEIKRKS